jgi:hypothetical protein
LTSAFDRYAVQPEFPLCRANHPNLFGNAVGLEVRKYRYFEPNSKGLDFQVGGSTAECWVLSGHAGPVWLRLVKAQKVRMRGARLKPCHVTSSHGCTMPSALFQRYDPHCSTSLQD